MNGLLRKVLLFVLVMAVVAGAGWFGRKAYKKHRERSLVAEARASMEKKDFRTAWLCLQRALQINALSVPASAAMADLLETAGLPAALGWRIRTAQLEPANMKRRFEWAEAALRLRELKSADQALSGVKDAETNSAAYHKLAGALAWAAHNRPEAASHYSEALRLEPTNAVIEVNLATIHLVSTNPATVQAARVALQGMARTNTALRTVALKDLAEEAEARKDWPDAIAYSKELRQVPSAPFRDKLGHLRLLREATNAEFGPYSVQLRNEAAKDPAEAFLYGEWCAAAEGPTNALRWLQSLPASVRTNQPVPLVVTDCQIALKDWRGILETIAKAQWGEGQYYHMALESLAQKSLGQAQAAAQAWQRALKASAHRLDRLSRLAQVTKAWGWEPEMTAVLVQTTSDFPKEKWASDALVAAYYQAGNTHAMAELIEKCYNANPSDNRLKNNLASVSLLRTSNLDRAHRFAREAYESATNNPFFASTYAYSLLLQNKKVEAAQIVSQIKTNYLQIPSVALYYGVVKASAGHKEAAKEALRRADGAPLLPEEKEILRLAKAKL